MSSLPQAGDDKTGQHHKFVVVALLFNNDRPPCTKLTR